MLRIRLAVALSVPLMALCAAASAQMRPVNGAEVPDHILAPVEPASAPQDPSQVATPPAASSPAAPGDQASPPATATDTIVPPAITPDVAPPPVPALASDLTPNPASNPASGLAPNQAPSSASFPNSGPALIPATEVPTAPDSAAAAASSAAADAAAARNLQLAPAPAENPVSAMAPATAPLPTETAPTSDSALAPPLPPSDTAEAPASPLAPATPTTERPAVPGSDIAPPPPPPELGAASDGVLAPPLPPDDHAPAADGTATSTPAPAGELALGVRPPPPLPKVKTPASSDARVKDLPDPIAAGKPRFRPLTHYALAAKADSLGLGAEVATVLSRSLNLRVGASVANVGFAFNLDGIHYNTGSHLKSGTGTIDWFPRHGGFHISGGVLYLETAVGGAAAVPAGQYFSLGNTNYVNSIDDPVGGTATFKYARKISPLVLIGFGNLIPRSGRHLTFPFELGAAYTGQAAIDIKLAGTACTTAGCFAAATDPETQSNLRQELTDINNHLKPYPFYPIISTGVAFRF